MNWLERFWTGCHHCKSGHECPFADAADRNGSHEPGRGEGLALPAMVVFLLPLATAIICSHLAGQTWAGDDAVSRGQWQITGMAGGLVVGIAVAKILTRRMRRRERGTDEGA